MTESSNTTRPDGIREESLLSEETEEIDQLLGVTLHDTYVIRREIGQGGMGRVYEAHHTRIQGKRFAIKVLRAEMMYSPEVRARFQREADAAASIDHVNVVGVHDFGYAPDGRPYLVSDFLTGIELSDHVEREGKLSAPTAIHIARQVCQGLEAAHARGVIHRDLKPENIFLLGPLDRPLVKVLDFGLSRFMDPPEGSAVTRTGVVMGTPSYMAPEQARGERVDHRVDVYGAGVILYVTLTGHPPFEEESPQQTVLAVMSREPKRPKAHVPSIPDPLEVIVQRAMARNVADRYATLADLDAALATLDVASPESSRRAPLASRRSEDDSLSGPVRSQVVVFSLLGLAILFFGLVTTLAGLPALLGMRMLSSGEFALAIVAVVGTLLTPFWLLMRWVRRRLWNNSLRVSELAPRIRGPVVAATAVYGLAMLLGRSLDAVAIEFSVPALSLGISGWAGWGPVLFGVSVVAACASGLRQRVLAPGPHWLRRLVAGPFVFALAAVAMVALTQFAVRVHAVRPDWPLRPAASSAEVPRDPQEAQAPAAVPPAQPPAEPGSAALTDVPPGPPSEVPPVEAPTSSSPAPDAGPDSVPPGALRASPAEVESASAQGAEALRNLQKRYPEDPAVLKALALELGKHPATEGQALETLDALFAKEPSLARERPLWMMVVKMARGAQPGMDQALNLMTKRMGQFGADLLFDLMFSSTTLRAPTRERLDSLAKLPDAMSPQLAIAFKLHTATDCAARLPLLPQARRDGDVRAVTALQIYSARSKKGCGPRKNLPCIARCPAEAAQLERAAQDIQARLSKR